MATVIKVDTAKPVVKSVLLQLDKYEALDVMGYIESWYKRNGYGANQHKTNGIYVALLGALDGKADTSAFMLTAPKFA